MKLVNVFLIYLIFYGRESLFHFHNYLWFWRQHSLSLLIVFDYNLNKFVFNDIVRLAKVKRLKPKKNSKFYDVKMVLKKL